MKYKRQASSKMGTLGKPLLIISALTALSVPTAHVALADSHQQPKGQTVAGKEITKDSISSGKSDNESSSSTSTGGVPSTTASTSSAKTSSASHSSSMGNTSAGSTSSSTTSSSSVLHSASAKDASATTVSAPSSSTKSVSSSAAASSHSGTSSASTDSTVKSSGGNKATISSAAQSTAQSSTKDRVNTQDVENPAEPNRAADNVGSETKTASTRNVTKVTNKKKVQATQANDTTVRTMASASSATKDVTVQFINDIGGAAQRIASKNDLYASVMIAQAILESKSGQSGLAQQGNNLFGIKGTYNGQYVTMNTSEYVNGKWIEVAAQFRKYPSLSASLQDYADLLRNGLSYNANYYAKVWKSNAATYKEAAQALQGTYATDPNYASKLDTLISTYQLTNYDDGKSANDSGKTISLSTTSNLTNTVSDSSSSGETVKTHGILYASSDAAHSVKTSLTAVQVKKVYSGAKNPYQVTHNGVIVGYLRTLSSGSASQTGSGNGSSGRTVKTHGILYASSDAAHLVKTSLTAVQVKRVYSGAKNPYQVTHNGVIVGYLRSLSADSAGSPGKTSGTSSNVSSTVEAGTTVKTNGVIYLSSTARDPLITSLKKVQVSKLFPSARNKYQVKINGAVVGYLRFATPASTSAATVKKTIGATLATDGELYVSSMAENAVTTSLKKVRVSKIFSNALNPYQVAVNGVVVGYLR